MAHPTLYLCDPRKNATCKGTVCFYDGVYQHLCYLTPDAACALTDAEGAPIALAEDGFASEIRADKMENEPRRMDHVFEEVSHARQSEKGPRKSGHDTAAGGGLSACIAETL